jgi:hypothetical protein
MERKLMPHIVSACSLQVKDNLQKLIANTVCLEWSLVADWKATSIIPRFPVGNQNILICGHIPTPPLFTYAVLLFVSLLT